MRHLILGTASLLALTLTAQTGGEWQSSFPVDRKDLGVKGSNAYFILTPGYQLSYRHGKDTVTDTVLAETQTIDGVECRVVEDRETKGGKLIEHTRDYYALDSRTNDVYYMGEDVDVYRNGKVIGHEGSWRSGVNGAKFGLMMPASPKAGHKFYQEVAPKVAMDRAEIVALGERVATPAGSFEKCIHVHESSPLEKGSGEHKWYAPGVGPVRDAEMSLVSYGVK